MKKDPRVYIDDVIKSCSSVAKYIEGKNKEQFGQDDELQDAVIRRLQIIGEAVKRLSQDFRTEHPEVAWKGATGMRDVLIHMYDEVDTSQVWQTITDVLPPFKIQLEELLRKLEENATN